MSTASWLRSAPERAALAHGAGRGLAWFDDSATACAPIAMAKKPAMIIALKSSL